jgi:hypothetical protein
MTVLLYRPTLEAKPEFKKEATVFADMATLPALVEEIVQRQHV